MIKTLLNMLVAALVGSLVTSAVLLNYGFIKKVESPCKGHSAYTPFDEHHCHFSSFRREADHPNLQYEVYFYGNEIDDGIWQFALFDKPGISAKLIGVEYIIDNIHYQKLTLDQQRDWHPLEYDAAALMIGDEAKIKKIGKMWGKSYRFWKPYLERVPQCKPALLWSFTEPNQINSFLIFVRDNRLEVNTEEIEKMRKKK